MNITTKHDMLTTEAAWYPNMLYHNVQILDKVGQCWEKKNGENVVIVGNVTWQLE